MSERIIRRGLLSISVLTLLLVAGVASAGQQTATLCHVPPGNPDKAHEIVVSESALKAHLQHHPDDFVGTCQARCVAVGACEDGNACTIDMCGSDGSCDNSQAVDCSDGDVCTIDACDPQSGCVNPPVPDANQVACSDGNACSENDVCVAGACSGSAISGCCTIDADCPASDACATRYCEDTSGTCKAVDLSGQCAAGACEVAFCDPVDGCEIAPITCPDDGDICTVAECNPLICGDAGGCETIPNPNPPEPGTELSCSDGLDNDCDGHADLLDEDCIDVITCNDADLFPGLVLDGRDWASAGTGLDGDDFFLLLEEVQRACIREVDAHVVCAAGAGSGFIICDDFVGPTTHPECVDCVAGVNAFLEHCRACVAGIEAQAVALACRPELDIRACAVSP